MGERCMKWDYLMALVKFGVLSPNGFGVVHTMIIDMDNIGD
jgi:hypothetical protein